MLLRVPCRTPLPVHVARAYLHQDTNCYAAAAHKMHNNSLLNLFSLRSSAQQGSSVQLRTDKTLADGQRRGTMRGNSQCRQPSPARLRANASQEMAPCSQASQGEVGGDSALLSTPQGVSNDSNDAGT